MNYMLVVVWVLLTVGYVMFKVKQYRRNQIRKKVSLAATLIAMRYARKNKGMINGHS